MSDFRQNRNLSFRVNAAVSASIILLSNALTVSPASADIIQINTHSDPVRINGDHSSDSYEMEGGTLVVSEGTVVGGMNSRQTSIEVNNGGHLVVERGATVINDIAVEEGARANLGESNSTLATPPAKVGALFINDGSGASLDKVVVNVQDHSPKGDMLNSGIENMGRVITTANTLITTTGQLINGITAHKRSYTTIQGSTIQSQAVGVAAQGGITNINGASISGWAAGIRHVAGDVNIQNSNIISQGGNTRDPADFSITSNAGLEVFTPYTDSRVTLHIDGSSITGQGVKSAGIVFARGRSDSLVTVNHSSVTGGYSGVAIGISPHFDAVFGPSTKGITLNLKDSKITGQSGPAVWVAREGNMDLSLSGSQTQLNGANGIALQTDMGSITNLVVTNAAIHGDVVNNGGKTQLTLDNGASWQGTFTRLSSLTTTPWGSWTMTGDSSVTGAISNGGTIRLGGKNTLPGHTLTVNGDFSGIGGNLVFNSALGSDDSKTDKLLIAGNTSGITNVFVNNVGGIGAPTLDGIELIQVKGNSAGTFTNPTRIVAGAYDYKLVRGANAATQSNWYLESTLNPGPGPGPDPVPVIHTIRPEAGSYIANQASSDMFLTTLHDRAGENRYMNVLSENGDVSSLWLRQVGEHSRFRDSSGQLRNTGNTYVTQLGGDLAQWSTSAHDRWHLGIMAGYGRNNNSTDSTVTGYSSKGSVDGYSAGFYSTWYQKEANESGAYIDSQLMYNWFTNQINGEKIRTEKYKSKGLTASVETGYTFAFDPGPSGSPDNPQTRYFLEPQAQVSWMDVKADALQESNGSRITVHGNKNIQTRLGLRAFIKGHSSLDAGTPRSFQPFVEINWLHNTKRNGVSLNGVSLEQGGAVNIGEVKLGVESRLTARTALWGNVGEQLGTQGYSNTTARIGVKYTF